MLNNGKEGVGACVKAGKSPPSAVRLMFDGQFRVLICVPMCADRGHTRFRQLVDWCGQDFDGLIIFDESELAMGNLNLQPASQPHTIQAVAKLHGRIGAPASSQASRLCVVPTAAPSVPASNRLPLLPSALCLRGRPQGQEPGA